MTKEEFDKLSKKDFQNGAVLDEIRKYIPYEGDKTKFCGGCPLKKCPSPCPLWKK